MTDEGILRDALQSTERLHSTLRTAKDYIDLYEAAGIPRELLVRRMTGKPTLHLPTSAKRRRRSHVSVTAGAGATGTSDDSNCGQATEEAMFHISVPHDPLPDASVQRRRAGAGGIVENIISLEASLQQLRAKETAPHKAAWLQHWHDAGRASDIVWPHTNSSGALANTAAFEREVFLTLKRPEGRRTRFEAMSSERSLARPVAVTLQRKNPTECHRSRHYPSVPSTARLEALPLPDRPTTQDRSSLLLLTPSHSAALSGGASEVRKWQQHIGLVPSPPRSRKHSV